MCVRALQYTVPVKADYQCVDDVLTISCLGPTWHMYFYTPGSGCTGPVMDVFAGNTECAGAFSVDCGYVIPSSSPPLARVSSAAVALLAAALIRVAFF